MNVITIAGQLGRDSELKQAGQEQILRFSVADSQGKEKPTIWHNCTLWGRRATSLQQYLTKGQNVTVTGSITQREYTDKDGQKKTAQEVKVNDLTIHWSRDRQEAPKQEAKPQASSGFADMDDDIPF